MQLRQISAWLVHFVTALGGVVGLFALWAISQHDFQTAFWLMGIAVLIDAVDGTFARFFNVKIVIPNIDGAMLDNIIDYLNYAVVPAYFLLNSSLISPDIQVWIAGLVLIVSAYQFSQVDAKTDDYFFKGFPSYWNIVVFYLYLLEFNQGINVLVMLLLFVAVFIPVKYIYPTRLEYFSKHSWQRALMMIATFGWGVVTLILLWSYPNINSWLLGLALGYILIYFALSIYRTQNPINK